MRNDFYKYLVLTRLLAEWDPFSLISTYEAPLDEYNVEAREILNRIKGKSNKEIKGIIREVFGGYFGCVMTNSVKLDSLVRKMIRRGIV